MRRQIGIKLLAAGTIIGSTNVSALPISHVSAEEITISESSADLQSLQVDEFQFEQEFSPEVKTYTASVANDIKSMNLTVEKKEDAEEAVITVNGKTIESGEKTNLQLVTGNNVFVITVANGTEVSSYTMTVDRAKSNNNQLSNLSLSNGDLAFDPETTKYSIGVKNEISKITVNPQAAADTATVQINGTTMENSEGHSVDLPVGSTTITIIVTAENGSKRTYTVTVIREAKEEEQVPSTNVVDKDPSTTTKPATETTSENDKLNVTKETTVSNANGTKATGNSNAMSATSSGESKSAANFDSLSATGGSEVKSTANLDVMSVSSDSETKTTANLASLALSTGTWDKSFASDEYTYHIVLANEVTSLTVSANTEESDAEIFIEDKEISSSSTVTIDDKAKTVISIVVKHDDDRKTYVLVFDKDIDEAETTDTAESVNTETETVSTETVDSGSKEEDTTMTKMNVRAESQTETASFWQKILSFFGL